MGELFAREELLREMQKAIRAVMAGEAASLEEAAWVVRNRSRREGRILPRCAVGTTLLMKELKIAMQRCADQRSTQQNQVEKPQDAHDSI